HERLVGSEICIRDIIKVTWHQHQAPTTAHQSSMARHQASTTAHHSTTSRRIVVPAHQSNMS
ncbi:hypothetical protein, partial [Staphylococcus aureus]|uniref:hypothetical protein n=1 Tax=Staphylococcus aureus TaxID=1280 RepID=UPI001FF28606